MLRDLLIFRYVAVNLRVDDWAKTRPRLRHDFGSMFLSLLSLDLWSLEVNKCVKVSAHIFSNSSQNSLLWGFCKENRVENFIFQ